MIDAAWPASTPLPRLPWLDIVMPYAGSVRLLREAVQSVLEQDAGGWRLSVVEDGPQDPSVGPWLRDMDDPRVVHVMNPHNLGVAANFQRCLDLATAEHVVFLGCDDRLHTNFVSVVRTAMNACPGADVVQPGVTVIDGEGMSTSPLGDRIKKILAPTPSGGETMMLYGEPLLTSLMHGNWAYFPSLCWRRDSIATFGFRQDLQTVLDLELLARLILDGGRLLWIPDVVFDYRRHSASASSISAVRTDRFLEERLVMNEISVAASILGWTSSARAANLRVTSRLHAALVLPHVLRRLDKQAARQIARHLFTR